MPASSFRCSTSNLRRLALLFLVTWLALTPLAVSGQVAHDPAVRPAELRISVPDPVVPVGEWATLTLEGGQPGQQGFFTSKMPLEYASLDGVPQPYPYLVTLDAAGRAQVRVRAMQAGNAFITFAAPAAGGELPTFIMLAFYVGDPPPMPDYFRDPAAWFGLSTYPSNARYLKDVRAVNHILVHYDLKGQSGKVMVIRNGDFKSPLYEAQVGSQGQVTVDVDMGSSGFGLVNELRAVAEVGSRKYYEESPTFFFTQIPIPDLSKALKYVSPFHIQGEGQETRYVADIEFPLDGMRFAAPTFISTDLAKQTQHGVQLKGKFIVPLRCRGEGDLAVLNGTASYAFSTQLYNVPLSGDLHGSGELTGRLRDCNVLAPELEGTIDAAARLRGGYNWEMKDLYKDILGDYAPTLFKGVGLGTFGKVGLGGLLETEMKADAGLSMSAPYFSSKLDMSAKLDLTGNLSTYVFPVMWLTADLNKTGGKLLYNSQARSSEFDKLYAGAGFGYHTDIWFGCVFGLCTFGTWKLDGGCSYSPGQPGAGSCSAKPLQVAAGMAGRPAPAADYAVFYGGAAADSAQPTHPALYPVTQTLVSNVYTFTSAALAWDPLADRGLLVWDHDDLAKPGGQSAELRFSHWDGAGWSAPGAITANMQQDFAPQVAWTSGDQAVAVWHQTNAGAGEVASAAGEDLTPELEIASATYDAAAHAWSAPVLLTDNAVADAGVRLVRNAAGELLAVWAQSDGGFSPDHPPSRVRLLAARYDGAWGTAEVAISDASGLADLAVGYGDGRGAIAYTRSYTPTGATWPVHQLFVANWHGSAWSASQPVTYDALDHRSPNVLYNAQGQPMVLWLADENLRLLNLVTGAQADLPLDARLGAVNEVRAVQTAQGDIAAVLRGQGPNDRQHDLWVTYYDRQHGLWGAPRLLSDSPARERVPAVALDFAGQLRLAYAATAIEHVPATTQLPDGDIVPSTAVVEGQTDLNLLRYRFDRNLTLPVDGLEVSVEHPAPGSTVTLSATVTNTGDLPLEGVTASFYVGDPASAGVLIGTATNATPLAVGASTTLAVEYRVLPDTGIQMLFSIAEAADQAAENDTADNRASKRAFGPDLALERVRIAPDLLDVVNLAARVRNVGTAATLPTTLDLHLAAITGTLLAQFAVPALEVGEVFTLTTPWEHGALPMGRQVLWAVANSADFDEVDTANNMASVVLMLGPNLMVDRYNTQAGSLAGGTVPVTVTVYNRGVEAGPITIAFYRDSPLLGGTAVLSRTVDSLTAGGGVQVTADLPGPLGCGLFVTAEAANGEVDSADNLVALARATDCAPRRFLPMLSRQ